MVATGQRGQHKQCHAAEISLILRGYKKKKQKKKQTHKKQQQIIFLLLRVAGQEDGSTLSCKLW